MHKIISLILSQGKYVSQTPQVFPATVADVSGNRNVADLAERPERRVITALQDIHIKLSYIWRRFVTAKNMSQAIFGIYGCHIPASSTRIQKQGHAIHAKQFTSVTRAVL